MVLKDPNSAASHAATAALSAQVALTGAKQEAEARHFGLAHTMYEALVPAIAEFQNSLAADQEVGACLSSFGQQVTISVTSIGYRNPHLMVFWGIDSEGREVQLVQHTSQVNLMLVPIPATSTPARRIGFDAKR